MMFTFLELAYMVDATQHDGMGWVGNDVLMAKTSLQIKRTCFLSALLLRVAKNHSFTTTRDAFCLSRTLEKRYGIEGSLQDRIKLSLW